MPDLEARGPAPNISWRRTLPDAEVTLGRSPADSTWAVPWDRQISRRHATLWNRDDEVYVRRCPQARNPIFFNGKPQDEFSLGVDEHFAIGDTVFVVLESPPSNQGSDLPPAAELSFSAKELHSVPYADAGQRIEALAGLPELIRLSPSDQELEARVLDVLLRGIPRADQAAVVWLDPNENSPAVQMRSSRGRAPDAGPPRPSRRLVHDAVRRRRQSVLYVWPPGNPGSEFTANQGSDWAFCVPLPDEPAPGWALYVSGNLPAGSDQQTVSEPFLKGDLKFSELTAEMFGSLRQVRDLQRRQEMLSRFLSRPVLAAIAGQDIDAVLKPRQADVTVMFCDLRGSCRLIEEGGDELADLCDRVGEALSIMTGTVTEHDGVIGDFQGDAALCFWGWPLPMDDQIERAARAALAIRRRLLRAAEQKASPLAGFNCGIGLAHGPAIAGRLGTPDQFKVGVFGPVVNLAARLESLTKTFRAPVLLDEPTAQHLRAGSTSHWARCRRLARVRPYGMTTELTVSELLPPAVEPGVLTEANRRDYEASLEAFLAGDWTTARELLQRLPQPDGAKDFLLTYMSRHQFTRPADWRGVVVLESK